MDDQPDGLLQILSQLLGGGGNPGMAPPSFAGAPVPSEAQAMPGSGEAMPAGGGLPPSAARFMPPPQARSPIGVPGTTVDPSGQGGLAEKLKAMLSGATSAGTDMPTNLPTLPGGQMIPTAAPARPPLQRPPAMMPPPRAAPPQSEPGKDAAAFFRRLFAGAAAVNPTSPKMSAFAQGGAGAMLTQQAEKERADKLKASQAGLEFNRTMAQRRDQRGENADKRADERLNISKTAGGKKPVWQLKKDAWLAANPGDETGALEYAAGHKKMQPEQVRAIARRLATQEQGQNASASDRKKIDERASEIEQQLMSGSQNTAPGASKLGGPALPEQPSLPESIAPPKPGAVMQGYKFSGGDPADPLSWEQAQ